MPYADPAIKRAYDRRYVATKRDPRRIADRVRKPFVGWDGEGYTAWVVDTAGVVYPNCHRYILFGNSTGAHIKGPNLETIKIFEFLLEHGSKTAGKVINISYAFDYDVNMMLGDVDERSIRRLRKAGNCYWRGYRIEHRPHKWFQLSRRNKDSGGRTSIRIYDIFAFFGGAFTKACASYLGTTERGRFVADGKAKRASFSYADLASTIFPYWLAEGKELEALANALRLSINSAGLYISQWHGPGALASALFQKYNYKDHISREIPEAVSAASRIAYQSGRFEPFRGGLFLGPVWIADIHNAYPYAFSQLPSLAKGKWHHLGSRDAEREIRQNHRMALYKIRLEGNGHDYTNSSIRSMPMPLFYRNEANRISYPVRVEGWYHAPESAGCKFLYKERCVVLEAWIHDDNGDLPFQWLEELYYERLRLKEAGDSAERAIKLGANATTGKAAQRIGWNEERRTPPPYHCLEIAGAITSRCRELVLMAAIHANRNNGLISIDTDGVISTTPFETLPNGIGPNLGQWEISEYTGILYIQNGVYWLRDENGNWLPPKSRGIPQSQLDFDRCRRQFQGGQRIRVVQNQFVGYGSALHGRWEKWRTWVDRPREIEFGGNGKRFHSPRFCLYCNPGSISTPSAPELHNFILRNPGGGISAPHNLPWIEEQEDDPDRPWELKRWEIIDDERS